MGQPHAFSCILFLTTVFSAALQWMILLALSAITDCISKREENMNQIYLLRFSYFYLSLSKKDVRKKKTAEGETSSINRMVHFLIHIIVEFYYIIKTVPKPPTVLEILLLESVTGNYTA